MQDRLRPDVDMMPSRVIRGSSADVKPTSPRVQRGGWNFPGSSGRLIGIRLARQNIHEGERDEKED